jgi:hypothetical protein
MIGVKCPQHACLVCDGKASNRGGLLFRCTDCPSTVCESCLPESFEAVDRNEVVAVLGFLSGSIEYIRCSVCLTKPPNALYSLIHQKGSEAAKVEKPRGPDTSSDRVEAGSSGGFLPASRHLPGSNKTGKMASRYGVSSSVLESSDDDLDTPLAVLKCAAPLDSDSKDMSIEGASGPAELQKRRLKTESSPDHCRPSRHCAIVGADARLARQLQESDGGAGAQTRSPKRPRILQDSASGEDLAKRRLPGGEDVELLELACSSAQTPTTKKLPNKSVSAVEIDMKPPSLQFPSNLSGNGAFDDRIEVLSD